MWVLTPQTKALGLPLLETHQLNHNGCYVYKQWGSAPRGHSPECNSYWNKSFNLNNAQKINNNQWVWSVGFIGQDGDWIHCPFANFQKVVVIEKWQQRVFSNSMSPKWSPHSRVGGWHRRHRSLRLSWAFGTDPVLTLPCSAVASSQGSSSAQTTEAKRLWVWRASALASVLLISRFCWTLGSLK